jgi:succinyl-CoA synthetase beta subunit
VNVLGGITRCDEVARGVVDGMRQAAAAVPLVVRLSGTNEAEGRRVLAQSGLRYETADGLSEAAARAVAASHSGAGVHGIG